MFIIVNLVTIKDACGLASIDFLMLTMKVKNYIFFQYTYNYYERKVSKTFRNR